VKALAAKMVIEILMRNGFILARQKGSHHIYRHETTGKIVPVPIHKLNKPLKIGTLLSIVKQSGIDRNDFKT